RACNASTHPAEIHRELRRQGTRRELRQRQPLDIVLLRDPPAVLDQVALHVSRPRDRSPEAQRAQLQEVARELPPGARNESRLRRFSRAHVRRRLVSAHRFAPLLPRFRAFLDKYWWRSSRTAQPLSTRVSSSSWAMATPAITCSMPAVSGRPYFESF